MQGGTFRALEGSQVSFLGTVSRPLAAASMQGGGQQPEALRVQGQTFATEPAGAPGRTSWFSIGATNWVCQRRAVAAFHAARKATSRRKPDLPDLPAATAILATDVMHIRRRGPG